MNVLAVSVGLCAAEPPYQQVRTQLAGQIASGARAEGERLRR